MDKKQFKKELQALIKEGDSIYYANVLAYDEDFPKNSSIEIQKFAIDARNNIQNPQEEYQVWYPKTYRLVKYLAPERLADFEKYYNDYIKEWLIALIAPHLHDAYFNRFEAGFRTQIYILSGIVANFDNPIFNLEKDIRHNIYKSEIDIAKDIQDQGHLKIAGAVAGVIIEAHLKTLVAKKDLPIKTENNKPPTMSNYNDALKGNTYDTATWRLIQRCGDIRNDCAHSNQDKPTPIEANDIIRAAEQIIADYN